MKKVKQNSLTFTNKRISELPVAEKGKRVAYYDTQVPHLMVWVYDTGKKVFYLYRWVNDTPTRIKLGDFPAIGVTLARELAEKRNGEIACGTFGAKPEEEKPPEQTLGGLFEYWLENYAKAKKKTWKEDKRLFDLLLHDFKGASLSQFGAKEVEALHVRIGSERGHVQANRVLALVSKLYNDADRWGMFLGRNPAKGVKRYPELSRERFLLPTETVAFFEALAGEPNVTMRDYLLMLLLTGARKSQLAAMRWDQIDWGMKVWRCGVTKNGKTQTIPLIDDAMELLVQRKASVQSEWVFPARFGKGEKHVSQPFKAFDRIRTAIGARDLRVHDLRRSLGSWLAIGGNSLLLIGKALNHQSPLSTAVYAHLYQDPIREAMTAAVNRMRE